jgi:hypothetical protein
MNERLGEIAYKGFCAWNHWVDAEQKPLPHWDQLTNSQQNAWIKAAEAVSKEIQLITGR